MANLKSITELPVVESAENLNLIVNDNGAAKQIPASAVGAQADWNQNDETAADYVKNRPFYEDVTVIEESILPLQAVALESGRSDLFASSGVLANAVTFDKTYFAEGDTYNVYYNGMLYECVSKLSSYGYFLGNHSFLAQTQLLDGEPFCVMWGGANAVYALDSSCEIKVVKVTKSETVHKIDPKYLPNVSRGVHVINPTVSWGDAAKEALLRGDTVYINEGTTGYILVTGFDIYQDSSGNNCIKVVSPVRSYGSGAFVTELRQFGALVTSVEVN